VGVGLALPAGRQVSTQQKQKSALRAWDWRVFARRRRGNRCSQAIGAFFLVAQGAIFILGKELQKSPIV